MFPVVLFRAPLNSNVMFPNPMPIEIEKITKDKESRQKRGLVLFLLISMCIEGICAAYAIHSPTLRWISENIAGPVIIMTAFGWCATDAKAKGFMLSPTWSVGLFVLAPICFPAYVIKERGLKPGAVVVAKAVGLLFTAVILSKTAENVTGYFLNSVTAGT